MPARQEPGLKRGDQLPENIVSETIETDIRVDRSLSRLTIDFCRGIID